MLKVLKINSVGKLIPVEGKSIKAHPQNTLPVKVIRKKTCNIFFRYLFIKYAFMKECGHLEKCKFGKEDNQTMFILNLFKSLMRKMMAISGKLNPLLIIMFLF